jgi:hypothetical protein
VLTQADAQQGGDAFSISETSPRPHPYQIKGKLAANALMDGGVSLSTKGLILEEE